MEFAGCFLPFSDLKKRFASCRKGRISEPLQTKKRKRVKIDGMGYYHFSLLEIYLIAVNLFPSGEASFEEKLKKRFNRSIFLSSVLCAD